MSADSVQLISAEKLCALTGLTDRRHRQLAKEGYFPPPIMSEYQMVAAINGMFRFYRELSQRMTRSLAEDKSLKTKREIELLELKIAEQNKRLVPLAKVERVWGGVAVALRQEILAADIPLNVKEDLTAHIRDIKTDEYGDEPDQDSEEDSAAD